MENIFRNALIKSENVDFSYFIKLALHAEISWNELEDILDNLTSTFEKSKQLNKVFLNELKSLQTSKLSVDSEKEPVSNQEEAEAFDENMDAKAHFKSSASGNEFSECDEETSDFDKTCELCTRRFLNIVAYRNHVTEHEMDSHVEKSENEMFDNGSEDLKDFESELTDCESIQGIPFKCNVCQMIFRQSSHLKSHRKEYHTAEKQIECDICKRRFAKSRDMTIHKRIHTTDKLNKCQSCEKSFRHAAELKIHTRVHTGEKPFVCEICSREFRRHCDLTKHLKVHPDEFPESVKCQFCHKTFNKRSFLKKHEVIHSGQEKNPCNVSSKKILQTENLKSNELALTDEKSFKCKTCNKYFTKMSSLKVHEIIHVNERQLKNFFEGKKVSQIGN